MMGFLSKLLDKVLDLLNDDPSLKWNLLMKHDGILTLKGVWETKEVYLYGRPLEREKAAQVLEINPDEMQFEWGSTNQRAHRLAFSILYQFMPQQEASSYTKYFCKDFIAKLPENDFETEFNLEFWRNQILYKRKPYTEKIDTEGQTGNMFDD